MRIKVNKYIVITSVFVCSLIYGQDFSVWKKEEVEKANTAAKAAYLSENERQVVMFMNLARIDGKKFFKTYMQLYKKRFNQLYQGNGIGKDNAYWKSLKKDLAGTKNLAPFQVSEKLTGAARYHAQDMGASGKTGHESTNGMTASQRGEKFAGTPYIGENCSYGFEDPLYIVGQLLLDDGVPSLGHRKNILGEEYGYYAVGVAIEEHKEYGHNCVIDYAVKVDGISESLSDSDNLQQSPDNTLTSDFKPELVADVEWKKEYSYNGGQFLFDTKTGSWREKKDDGYIFNFKEVSRKDNQAMLFDESRSVWLRLDSSRKTCEYSENGSDWFLLYNLTNP